MSSSPTPSPSPTPCPITCPYLKYGCSTCFLSNLSPAVIGIYDRTINKCVYNYTGTNLNSITTLQKYTAPIGSSYAINNLNGYSNSGSTSGNVRTWTVDCPTGCSSCSTNRCWS
jgi:hypothetical protein